MLHRYALSYGLHALSLFLLLRAETADCQIFSTVKSNFSSPEKRWLLKFQDHATLGGNASDVFESNRTESYERGRSTLRSDPSSSWFVDLPSLPVAFAKSPYLPEGECKRQVRRYYRELRNGTLWAVQMFDSSTKYPDGVLYGHTRHFGNFDQCYRLQAEIPKENGEGTEEMSTRYCLVDLTFHRQDMLPTKEGPYSLDFDPNGSFWEAIREKGDVRRVQRYMVQMALCVPSSCTAADVETALKVPLREVAAEKNVILQTTVNPIYSQSRKDAREFSIGAKIYCCIVLALFVLIVGCTWYDSTINPEEEEESTLRDLLLCFSARRNMKSILEIRYSHPGLDSIHLIRFFATCLVLVGHRTMQHYGPPTVNAYYFEFMYTLPSSMMLFNGTLIVDSFFSIGAFLIAYGVLEELEKNNRINFVLAVLIRFLRLTPAYAAVVFFYAYVLPHIGSGPLWKSRIEVEADVCRADWWANLFYINNYLDRPLFCMFQSWYLSVDFHLYIISLFLLYIFWRLPRKTGYWFLSSVLVASIVFTFYEIYVHKTDPCLRPFPSMREIHENTYFKEFYAKSHMRTTAYFVGIIAAAIVFDHKNSTWRLSKVWSRVSFLLFVVCLSITIQNVGFRFFDPNVNWTPFESALYGSLHRGLFAFATCSLFVLLTIGDGLEFNYNFMTPPWVQPLARLTYGTFLVHNIHQMYQIGTLRSPKVFSIHNMFWEFVPDVIYAFSFSLLIVLGIEGPFRKIEKRFILKRGTKKAVTEKDPTLQAKKMS